MLVVACLVKIKSFRSASAEGRGSGSAGNGISSNRTARTVANAATAGLGWINGSGRAISDIKLLLAGIREHLKLGK